MTKEIKIVSPNKKVKMLRQKLKITQEDLAGTKITKSYLSKIENEKVNLTEDLATFFCRKFNKVAKEKAIYFDFVISTKWLLQPEKEQANKIINNLINNLKDGNNIVLKELEYIFHICEKYQLNNKYFEICKVLTSYFFTKYENIESIKYCNYGLKKKTSISIANKYFFTKYLSANYIELNQWDEALKFANICLNLLSLLDKGVINLSEEYNNIYYNISIIYKNLKQEETSLKYLNKINTCILKDKKQLDVIFQRGNCYLNLNNIIVAIKCYNYVLNYSKEKELKAKCYRNLAECYYKTKNYSKAKDNIEKCLLLRKNMHYNYNLIENLQIASDIYIEMGKLDIAEKYLLKALNIRKDKTTLEKLIAVYILSEDIVSLEKLNFDPETINVKVLIQLIVFYQEKNSLKSNYYLNLLYKIAQ